MSTGINNCTRQANSTNLSPSSSSFAPDSSSSNRSTVILAIVCVIISSFSTTFGLFFQKIAHKRGGICGNSHDSRGTRRRTFLYWLFGFLMMTLISFPLDLYSMANLGQSLVVPLLAGLEVAENQIFAPYFIHASVNKKYDYSAAVIVVIGASFTSIWGPKGGATSSNDSRTKWEIGHHCTDANNQTQITAYEDTVLTFNAFAAEPLFVGYETTVILVFFFCLFCMKFEPACMQDNLFFVYGYVAGFLGGQQNLFLKGVGTFLLLAFDGSAEEVFADWYVYVFLSMMIVLPICQLSVINMGLGKFSVLQFVPAFTVLYIVSGTSVGLFFYQEHKQLQEFAWIMFGVGFFFIFLSLAILGCRTSAKADVVKMDSAKAFYISPEIQRRRDSAQAKRLNKDLAHVSRYCAHLIGMADVEDPQNLKSETHPDKNPQDDVDTATNTFDTIDSVYVVSDRLAKIKQKYEALSVDGGNARSKYIVTEKDPMQLDGRSPKRKPWTPSKQQWKPPAELRLQPEDDAGPDNRKSSTDTVNWGA